LPTLIHQRSYVSETRPTHATINVNTAIKEDQKVFMKNVGKKLDELRLSGSGVSADAAMSPAAGIVVYL
jgi:cysteine desulfurase